jgi:hypothetical protein
MFDKDSIMNDDDELNLSTNNRNQHNKSHKFIVIEPNIYHGKLLKNSNLQLYTYLHSQILFSIITLKLTRLLAYSSSVSSQEKDSLMINDDLVYYKDISLLHSNCIRIIIKCLNHIYSPKVHLSPSTANNDDDRGRIKQKIEIFSTYSQEILMGLLTTIIQSNVNNLVDNNNNNKSSIKFNIINKTNEEEEDEHVFNLDDLIGYLISIIIKRNDHYYEENLIYMVINSITKLLEYSEPNKVDLIMYCLNNEMNELIEVDVKNEMNFKVDGEYTLDYIIEWINQGVQCSQIDLVYNYIKLICKLALNKKWKPAVDSTFSRLLDSLLEMNTGNEQKILNFLCSLIFTPVIVFSGQWIEYKDSD